jgi:hypothetical protein
MFLMTSNLGDKYHADLHEAITNTVLDPNAQLRRLCEIVDLVVTHIASPALTAEVTELLNTPTE